MTSVSLLYILTLYLLGAILFYEYFIRYVLVSLYQSNLFGVSEQKNFFNYSFLPGNFSSLTSFVASFYLTQKYTYISLVSFSLVLQFTFLLFILLLLLNYKHIYIYALEQSNLIFILFSFYIGFLLIYILPLLKDYIFFLVFLELLGVIYYFFFFKLFR